MGPANQRGLILALSLFFMLLVTVIGLFLFRSSALELRMAGNAGAKAVAFESAETARVDGENGIVALADSIAAGNAYDCTTLGIGFYAIAGVGDNCGDLDLDAMEWDGTDSVVDPNDASARIDTVYMGVDQIFEVGNDVEVGAGEANTLEVHVFRVVGRGRESSGGMTTVESTFLARDS